MIDKKTVIELAQERIDELDKGLYLVDVVISKKNVINIEVDALEGSVAIMDCVSVSRNVEHNLDREDADFELSVMSPGIDQPFKVHQQYIKNVGRDVKVVFNEHGSIEGKLKSANEKEVTIETTTKERIEGKKKKEIVVREHVVTFDKIKETRLIISFK